MVEITPTDGPGQFAMWRRNVDRQLAALSTMRRTPHTEIYTEDGDVLARFSAEGLQFFDAAGIEITKLDTNGLFVQRADGTDIIVMGQFGDGVDIFEGTAIYDGDGRSMVMTRSDMAGLVKPDIPAPFVRSGEFTAVTSGSFVVTHEYNPRGVYHNTIRTVVGVGSDAATVGQIRLREVDGGAVTSTLTTTAGSFQHAVFEWLHGRVPGDDPGSQGADFVIEARRTSGSGNVDVYTPNESTWSSSALVPDADTDGNAHWS